MTTIGQLRAELTEAERDLTKLRGEMDETVDKMGCVPADQAMLFARRLESAHARIGHLKGAIRTAERD